MNPNYEWVKCTPGHISSLSPGLEKEGGRNFDFSAITQSHQSSATDISPGSRGPEQAGSRQGSCPYSQAEDQVLSPPQGKSQNYHLHLHRPAKSLSRFSRLSHSQVLLKNNNSKFKCRGYFLPPSETRKATAPSAQPKAAWSPCPLSPLPAPPPPSTLGPLLRANSWPALFEFLGFLWLGSQP